MAVSASKSKSTGKASGKGFQAQTASSQDRYSMIAEAAYYRAEQRGFQDGDPVADWLAAEKEIDQKQTEGG